MKKSIHKQIPEREQIKQELMDCMCECCHYPHILSEDALPAQCERCDIERRLNDLI